MSQIHNFKDAPTLAQALCVELQKLSQLGRPVHIALSGGSTPKLWFATLAQAEWRQSIQWENLHFWWGDERCVPLSSTDSNAGEAIRIALGQTAAHLHVLRTELQPEAAAQNLQQELGLYLPLDGGFPKFDWMILGIGEDGHTASLFPGYEYPSGIAHTASHPVSGQIRVSLSHKSLIAAHRISFLCSGPAKKPILGHIFAGSECAQPWPAFHVFQDRPDSEFWVDFDMD